MANALSVSRDRLAKVVLVGSAGAGKSAIVKAVAEKYAHASVRAGEIGEGKVYRTEFFWPEPMSDGGQLRVRLYGLSGAPVYKAVEELVLADADGVVFVGNLARDEGDAVLLALHSMALNAQQNGMDLTKLPAAVHYHRASAPAFEPDEMDAWLGITPGAVPRFVTGPEDHSQLRSSVEWTVAQIANRSDRVAESPTHPRASTVASEP
jgi:hypothetical protein